VRSSVVEASTRGGGPVAGGGKEVRQGGGGAASAVDGERAGPVGGGEGGRRRGCLHSHRWAAEKAGSWVEGDGSRVLANVRRALAGSKSDQLK
jgi:hypothetical protein